MQAHQERRCSEALPQGTTPRPSPRHPATPSPHPHDSEPLRVPSVNSNTALLPWTTVTPLLIRSLLYSLSHNRGEREQVLVRSGYEEARWHQDTLSINLNANAGRGSTLDLQPCVSWSGNTPVYGYSRNLEGAPRPGTWPLQRPGGWACASCLRLYPWVPQCDAHTEGQELSCPQPSYSPRHGADRDGARRPSLTRVGGTEAAAEK